MKVSGGILNHAVYIATETYKSLRTLPVWQNPNVEHNNISPSSGIISQMNTLYENYKMLVLVVWILYDTLYS